MQPTTYHAFVSGEGILETRCQALAGKCVEIRERKAQRSSQANARYWALLTEAAESLGWDSTDDLHESVAWHLLREPNDERTGLARRKRTPKLNTAEFAEYVKAVERLLIDMGADLTDWMQADAVVQQADGYKSVAAPPPQER